MKRINLLPQEQQARASRERGLVYAILILVAVVVVLGLVYMKYNSDVNAKSQQVADLQAQTMAMEAKAAELQQYAVLQTQRTTMTETAKNIYAAGVPFSIILQEISLVIQDDVWLDSITATVPDSMLPGTAAPAATGPGTSNVTFVGRTKDHRDVAEFMTRLGLMPQIMDISLGSSQGASTATAATTTTTTDGTDITFTLTAQLRPYVQTPPATTLAAAQ